MKLAKIATMNSEISNAVNVLRAGGVIAYPTEYCFGLGCDPRNEQALEKLLAIKGRKKDQGVILVAANIDQVADYALLDNVPLLQQVKDSWPGPNTWILPTKPTVSSWVKGLHTSIAMRVSAHPVCQQLCLEFDHAIVSTSANRHGQDALLLASDVLEQFANDLDYIVDLKVGGADQASTIRDAMSGKQLR